MSVPSHHIITLKKNEDRRIREGHLWAFSNEILKIEGEPQAGDIVKLHDHRGTFMGIGFYNPYSLIAVRMLSGQDEPVDFQFFHRRISLALSLRSTMYPDSNAVRIIHGETDFLPGLIIDKYGSFLSVQTFSFGMDKRLTLICDVLESLFHPQGIVERNESPVRSLENLPLQKGVLRGTAERVEISEYGINYSIDLLDGQKTGFFLDQRENRFALRRYVANASVLDCFCNEGGFALHAAAAGASNVVGVDISEATILRARNNASLNSFKANIRFVTQDAFEFLAKEIGKGTQYDVINLDPPSFAKNKKTVRNAIKGYKELHELALRALKPGGILATASCSHHITEETFLDIVNTAVRTSGRTASLLEWRGAAPDHPTLPSMPETKYLKFGIFHIV